MYTRDEFEIMVQVARMYYENNLTQEEIANRLNLSRQKVSRLLIEARTQGIVRISVIDPTPADPGLRQELKDRFHLHEVVLASGEKLEGDQLRAAIGLAASEYLTKVLRDDQTVGIGWGRTLFDAVNLLRENGSRRISVIPLIGGVGDISPFFQVNELGRRLAEAFHGSFRHLYAPAFIQDSATLDSLLKTQEICQVVDLWKRMDVAIVGIGHVGFQHISSMFFADHITPATLAQLEAKGTIGDICARFFDIHGSQVYPETGVIGIDLDTLKTIPDVIAIAGGSEKVKAVLGALRGSLIKTLVTDTATARAVLAEDSERR
jgi:deoxyribonucleoside regulator